MKALDELKGHVKYQEEDTLKSLREGHPDYINGNTFKGYITSRKGEETGG